MAAVEAVLVGGGNRGRFTYGGFARRHPDRLRIVALAEPVPDRREVVAKEHALSHDRVVGDWRELLERPALAPVAIIATGDTMHVEPALAALAAGYHVLLEKPIAPDPADCVRVVEAAERAGRMLQIGHVLRYTQFYNQVQQIVASGRLGEIVAIDMKEHVAHWHLTHSYVRGKFRNRRLAAPIVLAKTCHDLDLMAWLVGRPARRVASFGSLSHFRPEQAPKGAPARCTDGCPVQDSCPHDAVRFYLGPDDKLARLWPWTDLGLDPAREARRRALESGPYGVCVYHADNDVPDHQVLAIEFETGITATFTLQGLATHERRTIRVSGTKGELRGIFQEGLIEVTRHGSLETEHESVEASLAGHGGGDDGLLSHFTDVVSRGAVGEVRASGRVSLESHLIGFAAEEARQGARVVEMDAFRAGLARDASAA
jgi:predicted dehydrogenase